MKWSVKQSVLLSRVFIGFFAALLLFIDAELIYVLATGKTQSSIPVLPSQLRAIRICVCSCSVPAWCALIELWRLMGLLCREEVFSPKTVRLLRIISWCCFTVSVISGTVGLLIHFSLIVITVAAALMGLIVRIVKNIVVQAAVMKDELDYTV